MKNLLIISALLIVGSLSPGQTGDSLPEGFASKLLKISIVPYDAANSPRIVYGLFIALENDTLQFMQLQWDEGSGLQAYRPGAAQSDPHKALPLSRIAKLETRKSGGNRTLSGIAFGFAGGALAGVIIGTVEKPVFRLVSSDQYRLRRQDSKETYDTNILAFGFGGAVIGGLLGSTVKADRWVVVDLNRHQQPPNP